MSTSINAENVNLRYASLAVKRRQFRLLTVQEVDATGVIHCGLETISLETFPDYVALSYVWGTGVANKAICVNGTTFYVRPNLYDFLIIVAVREYVDVKLFVDAVCIDQSNVSERESQVKLMKDIYSNALHVVAWLGSAETFSRYAELDSSSLQAMQKTKKVSVRNAYTSAFHTTRETALDERLGPSTSSPAFYDGMENNRKLLSEFISRFARMRDALVHDREGSRAFSQTMYGVEDRTLYKSHPEYVGWSASYVLPFWERLWIVQEVILARSLTLFIDEVRIEPKDYPMGKWLDMSPSVLNISYWPFLGAITGGHSLSREISVHDLITRREEWRSRLRYGPPIKLYEVLIRFCRHKTSNPLDHVFALLGLAESKVVPDYSIVPIELFAYVLVEGFCEIGLASDDRNELNARVMFYPACLSAFDFSASDATIAAIAERSMCACGASRWSRIAVLWSALYLQSLEIAMIKSVRRSRADLIITTITDTLRILWMLIPAASTWGDLYLRLQWLRICNLDMTGPNGEMIEYDRWMAFVDDTYDLVKRGAPPMCRKSGPRLHTPQRSMPTRQRVVMRLFVYWPVYWFGAVSRRLQCEHRKQGP